MPPSAPHSSSSTVSADVPSAPRPAPSATLPLLSGKSLAAQPPLDCGSNAAAFVRQPLPSAHPVPLSPNSKPITPSAQPTFDFEQLTANLSYHPQASIFIILLLRILFTARSFFSTWAAALPFAWDWTQLSNPLANPFGLKPCPYRRPGPVPKPILIMRQVAFGSLADAAAHELAPGAKAPHYPFISPPSAFLIPSISSPSTPLPWDAPSRAAWFLGPRTASSEASSANPANPLSSSLSSSQSAICNLQSAIPSRPVYQTAAAFSHG